MIDPLDTGDLDKDVARRLILTRLALGRPSGEYAEEAGLTQSNYSQMENLLRRVSIRAAMKLCHAYGLTLDWLYRGDPSGLPISLHEQIREARKQHAERVMREIDEAAQHPKVRSRRSSDQD